MNNEEQNREAEPVETMRPQPTAAPWQTDAVMFGIVTGFAVMILFAWKTGYDQGLREPGEVLLGPLVFAILSILFSGLELCFFLRIVKQAFAGVASGLILPALLVAPLMLGSYHSWAFNIGECAGLAKQGQERVTLRAITRALERYSTDCGAYPPSIQELVGSEAYGKGGQKQRDYLENGIPSSAFDARIPLRYVLANSKPSSSGVVGMVWFPGPDRKYDIQDGPELKAALGDVKAGSPGTWLLERTYDPSNGASGGDMIKIFP